MCMGLLRVPRWGEPGGEPCGLSYLQVHPTLPNTKNPPLNYPHMFMHMHTASLKRESSAPWTPLYTATLAPLGGTPS